MRPGSLTRQTAGTQSNNILILAGGFNDFSPFDKTVCVESVT